MASAYVGILKYFIKRDKCDMTHNTMVGICRISSKCSGKAVGVGLDDKLRTIIYAYKYTTINVRP